MRCQVNFQSLEKVSYRIVTKLEVIMYQQTN